MAPAYRCPQVKGKPLSQRADPPFVAMRNRRADQYLPRMRDAIYQEFARTVRLAARRAELEARTPITEEMRTDLAQGLYQAQRTYIWQLAGEGYAIAGSELGAKSLDFIVRKQPEELALPDPVTARHTNIEAYLRKTSNVSAGKYADRVDKIFDDVRTYWDDEKKQGLTPRQIADRLHEFGLSHAKSYSNLIARTTSIWSMNEGAEVRYLEAGITQEEWLATNDDLSCPYCMQMDGRRGEIKDSFLPEGAKLNHPEIEGRFLSVPFDVGHPPLHPYCRCTIIPVIEQFHVSV